jgi:hypothetical protein
MATSELPPPTLVSTPSKAANTPPIAGKSPNSGGKNTLQKTDASTVEAAKLTGLLPGEEPENPDEEPIPHHAAGFWNQPWVQNVLPLASSLALHVAIITIGVLFYLGAKAAANEVRKEQLVIPETASMDKKDPGGILHPGPQADPSRAFAQDQTHDTDDSALASDNKSKLDALDGGSSSNDDDSSSSLGKVSSQGRGKHGGGGSGDLFGGGQGGKAGAFGVPGGGGGLGPKSNFFGMGGNARKVVYLCDCSGSMLGVFGTLKQELKDSISTLSIMNGQQFDIIFFNEDIVKPLLFNDGMSMATQQNIQKANEYVENSVSSGGTQPITAIEYALGVRNGKLDPAKRPELLWVLTDGFDQIANFDDVTNAFKKWNADGKVHVKCIFLESDPDPKLEECLKKIATNPVTDFKKKKKSEM